MFLAPLSEIYGRNKIYNVGNVLYAAFTAGCALSQNLPSLIAFRVLSGFVGGAPITNTGGTVGDMISIHHRGAILSLFGAVDTLAPIIGPLVGGFVSGAVGWRWNFWILCIFVSLLPGTNYLDCVL